MISPSLKRIVCNFVMGLQLLDLLVVSELVGYAGCCCCPYDWLSNSTVAGQRNLPSPMQTGPKCNPRFGFCWVASSFNHFPFFLSPNILFGAVANEHQTQMTAECTWARSWFSFRYTTLAIFIIIVALIVIQQSLKSSCVMQVLLHKGVQAFCWYRIYNSVSCSTPDFSLSLWRVACMRVLKCNGVMFSVSWWIWQFQSL